MFHSIVPRDSGFRLIAHMVNGSGVPVAASEPSVVVPTKMSFNMANFAPVPEGIAWIS